MNITDITQALPDLPIPEGQTVETLQDELDKITSLVEKMPDAMKQTIRKGLGLSLLIHGPDNVQGAVIAAAKAYGRVMREQSIQHGIGDPDRIARNAESGALALGTHDVFKAMQKAIQKSDKAA